MGKWRISPVGIACLVLAAWFVHSLWDLCYDHSEEKRQGRRIVDEIKTCEAGIVAYWSPGRKAVGISVYGVTDQDRQEQVVEWVRALKATGEVNYLIEVNFYERENWIETPKNERGAWSGWRGAEKLLRSVKL